MYQQGSSEEPGSDIDISHPSNQARNLEDIDYESLFQDYQSSKQEDGAFADFLHNENVASGDSSQLSNHCSQSAIELAGPLAINYAGYRGPNSFSDIDFEIFGNTSSAKGALEPPSNQLDFDFFGSTPSTEQVLDPSYSQSLGHHGAAFGSEGEVSPASSPSPNHQVPARTNLSSACSLTKGGAEASQSRNRRLTITVDDADESDVAAIVGAVLQSKAKVTVQRN